ncbi:MAG: DUF4920 domain-containing protein [Bacteroidota bacterium]|nr:DUF4920 domain-containing protein [Bacteroidota bacterium]
MKKTFVFIIVTLFLILTTDAETKRKFGKELTVKEKTKISDVLSNPEKFDGKKIQVEGTIIDVCEKRGCWIKIGNVKGNESIQFKVDDGVIVFPMEINGQYVVAEGILSVKKYSKEELLKIGEEQAKEEGKTFDPNTVTEPKTVIQIKGEGAVVGK